MLSPDEKAELIKLRKENKVLADGEKNLKKGERLLRKRNEVRYCFIKHHRRVFPISLSCQVMRVSRAAYHAWANRPAKLISAEELG